MDSGDDFALGDGLAAADNPAVARILGDESRLLLVGELLEANLLALAVPAFLFFERDAHAFEQLGGILRDSRRGGQTG